MHRPRPGLTRLAPWILAFAVTGISVPRSSGAEEPGVTASEESSKSESGLLGKAARFQGKDLSGKQVTLESLLAKGPVLVDFWATWCKPCLKELPYLQRIHEKYSKQGLQVLAVTIDAPKTESRVKPFVMGKKYTFTVLLDSSQEVFRALQGKGTIPYVVAIDKDGNIRYRHTGYRPGDELELERVAAELVGAPVPEPAGEPAKDAAETESSAG
jgi:thiol-disulfide isomerase/thioredoxin